MRPAHGPGTAAGVASQPAPDGALRWAPILLSALILAAKIPLLWQINVNWDEFYFLNLVYARARGALTQVFQTAYTEIFLWLTSIHGYEVAQVVVARGVMLALLAVTALLIWRLAARWASPVAAGAAPLAYLASSPVLRHGDSFRADSMLAPLTLAILLLFTNRTAGPRANVAAGACFGVALALTVKAALLVPVLLACALLEQVTPEVAWRSRLGATLRRLLMFGLVAAVVAGVILLLHRLSLGAVPLESPGQFAARASGTTLLHVPLFPRRDYFQAIVYADLVTWILIAIGLIAAFSQRRYALAAFGLSLLPIAFYRNTFPYYYVAMLGPACVLAAAGVDAILALVRRTADQAAARRMLLAAVIALSLQAALHLFQLREDRQSQQRATIAAVHRIFPHPVPYIDHSGMVSSFPKTNFFMTSWGLEEYRARGVGFMGEVMSRFKPPLLLANREMLEPESSLFRSWLFPEDQDLIRKFFLPYWGPIYIAGAEANLTSAEAANVQLPYAGRYRLNTSAPVVVDGQLRHNGDVIEVGESPHATVEAAPGDTPPVDVRFYWAAAEAPPREAPPDMSLYFGL